ncbi:FtsX-like permease family protein [Clostridium algidicarnis]|uniref:FtsX-like permease family protein n=1 Tax=Clostridium algidicarnis TaxID=37659 RepID=UPI001C0AF71C|nr:FtsX-like permease family protein [Clostridium algidicarnis]MBU3197239.1 FtsX-like permease family protein [Clostridium algidicarnis]
MKKTFLKNLGRDIRKTRSRFLSIVIIIAVGVSFYAGVRATSPDMKISADRYFNENNLMDFKLISTLGLTKEDVDEVEKQSGVTNAVGAYSLDGVIEKDNRSLVMNINSLKESGGINDINVVNGRRPENNNEAIVEDKFLKANNLDIGSKIVVESGSNNDIGDSLKNNEFEIVGTADSPLYISLQRQLSSVGNGSVKGFIYILEDVFKSEVYTEVYVRTDNNQSKSSLLYNEKYKEESQIIEEDLKTLGVKRSGLRYDEILETGNTKINEAQEELNASKKEAEDKFKDAYSKLENEKDKISQGEEELKKSEDIFNKKMEDGENKIKSAKVELTDGKNKLNIKSQEIEDGKLQIKEAKSKLYNSENQIISGKGEAASNISSAILGRVALAKAQLDSDPNNPEFLAEYNLINDIYKNNIKGKDFDNMYNSLKDNNNLDKISYYFNIEETKANFDNAALKISIGKKEVDAKEALLQKGEKEIESGRKYIEENEKKLSDSEVQLNKGREEGLKKLNEGKDKLKQGQKAINENLEKLKIEEENANKKIKEGQEKIEKNRYDLNHMKDPEWYVLGRSTNVGYETYRQDSDRMDNIGRVFPLIFFLVAALVSLTTMTRMVQEKRIEIGTFKALGYSITSIVSHYLIYSLAASFVGIAVGISFGFTLFPKLIIKAYGSLYTIPYVLTPFNVGLALKSGIIVILFISISVIEATLGELKEVPASLMRPKAPKSGKVILLERINFLWKRLSFTRKVTARNVFRYKQRLFMTVIGVAACTGLMITGFGIREGIVGSTENQFNKIYKYDVQSNLTSNINEDEKDEMKDKIIEDSNIKSVLFSYSKNGTVKEKNPESEDVYIVVPENAEDINSYINLTMKEKDLNLDDEGVIITEKLAKIMGKSVGDSFKIIIDDTTIEAKISHITEHYVMHYIYMSPKYYEKVTGESLKFNGFYGLLQNTEIHVEDDTSKFLTKINGVNSVSFKNNIQLNYDESVKSINAVVLVLIVSAGVLAFVVIYNLTNININERRRELATIKLLGFYNKELASYIYRENTILTVIGSLTGIGLGVLLNNFVIISAETNILMFIRKVPPIYFLYSVGLTMIFSIIVNLAMYKKFDKIDMIESLKSAE